MAKFLHPQAQSLNTFCQNGCCVLEAIADMKVRANDEIRTKIYTVVFRSDTPAGKLFDLILLWLILFSILSVFLESVASIRQAYLHYIRAAEWFFTIIFTLEYILRIYSSRKPLTYIFSFYGLIDLIAILPAYLSLFLSGGQYLVVVRAFRLLRVFRILKLSRFLYEGNILGTALKASMYKITVFVLSVVTLVTIIGTLMYIIEGDKSGFQQYPCSYLLGNCHHYHSWLRRYIATNADGPTSGKHADDHRIWHNRGTNRYRIRGDGKSHR